MCVTIDEAVLSSTYIYSGEGTRNGMDVHVLAYQNNATNLAKGPNAMVIPFPTDEEMDENNVIDTRKFKTFLHDITNASKHLRLGRDEDSFGETKGATAKRSIAKVFDVGSYTVVLAKEPSAIPEALKRVPEHRRPNISYRFLLGYSELYPDQPIAICCFDGTFEAEPLLWWYRPKHESRLFVPTMDAHDGEAPKLSAAVQTDHIVSVGSSDDTHIGRAHRVRYTETIPEDVKELLPNFVHGVKFGSVYKNGDMFIETDSLMPKTASYKDLPKLVRGTSFEEAIDGGTVFYMSGWG